MSRHCAATVAACFLEESARLNLGMLAAAGGDGKRLRAFTREEAELANEQTGPAARAAERAAAAARAAPAAKRAPPGALAATPPPNPLPPSSAETSSSCVSGS